jgi:hypothetical protein
VLGCDVVASVGYAKRMVSGSMFSYVWLLEETQSVDDGFR